MAAMCKRPGCVAEATGASGMCPIHAAYLGTPCDYCRGSGELLRGEKHMTKTTCDRCAGTGLKDKHKTASRIRKDEDPVDRRGVIQVAESDRSA